MTNSNKNAFNVKEFYKLWKEKLNIKLISGKHGLTRQIHSIRVQKPGLRIIKSKIILEEGKIQILGQTEVSYLNKLGKDKQEKLINSITAQNVPCFIFSKGLKPNKHIEDLFTKKNIPIFKSGLSTGELISEINEILAERLAPLKIFHGVLIDIHRLGVLILGRSGIGKSECALDLIIKGSKLVADDVVEIRKVSTSKLIGTGPETIKYLMEIRGIGIVNIKDLFGTTSVMDKREIDMVIELDQWDKDKEYERLGIDTRTFSILDLEIPHVVIPVSPGRNISTIIEVAVRNQILKRSKISYSEEPSLIKNNLGL